MSSKDADLEEDSELVAHRASRVHAWLEPVLRNSAAAKQAYRFKDRLKPWTDIRSKVLARRNDPKRPQSNYQPCDVSDASGFRIVKLFNAEVPEALDQLLALLKTDLQPGDANGKLNSVMEIEFHTSRRLSDPLSIYQEVQSVVQKHGFTLKQPIADAGGNAASSYSSVHVVVECTASGVVCRSEIQLRSVFEEAWGEISHRLKYAPAKIARALGGGAASALDDEPSSDFLLHLDALKSLTDGCAQYADLINRELQRRVTGPADRKPTPLDPAGKSAALFTDYGEEMRKRVEQAYRARSEAVDAKPAARADAFRRAADQFREIVRTFPEPKSDDDSRLLDVLREELAYCNMFTKNAELRDQAEQTYRELVTKRPDRVSILLRLGQLRRDAGDYAEGKSLMERGLKVAAEQPDPDPDVRQQVNWVLRRDLAYVCWRLVDLDPGRSDAAALLDEAIKHSETSLEYVKNEDQRLNTLQNLLYYLVDVWNRLPAGQKELPATRGREVLNELRPKVDLENWGIEELDSVERAEFEFGDRARAKAAASVIIRKLAARTAAMREERNLSHARAFEALSHDERDMYLYAQDVLASGPLTER